MTSYQFLGLCILGIVSFIGSLWLIGSSLSRLAIRRRQNKLFGEFQTAVEAKALDINEDQTTIRERGVERIISGRFEFGSFTITATVLPNKTLTISLHLRENYGLPFQSHIGGVSSTDISDPYARLWRKIKMAADEFARSERIVARD